MSASRLSYNPSLDGLRAVAVAMVVAAHVGLPRMGGYHGVTVFFVISGYLITTLLLIEYQNTGHIDFRRFYQRRLARLTPALLLVVAVTTVWLLTIRKPFEAWWAGLVGSTTYVTDIFEAIWGNGAIDRAFEWSWSLSIEEQFYLVWPALLLLLLRRGKRSSMLAGLAVVVPVVWAARHVVDVAGATHAFMYFGPLSHIDALVLGVIVAVITARFPGSVLPVLIGRVIGPVGAIGLGVLLVKPGGLPFINTFDPGAFGQTALCSAGIVLWIVTTRNGWFARVLTNRTMVLLGKLSYGIYLWNMLLVMIFEHAIGVRPGQSWWGVMWLAALVGIAYLSWRFVETPLRKKWAPRHTSEDALALPPSRPIAIAQALPTPR